MICFDPDNADTDPFSDGQLRILQSSQAVEPRNFNHIYIQPD